MKPIAIMGVPISPVTNRQIPEIVSNYLAGNDCSCIMTPNPEMVMAAQKHDELLKALKNADLVLPDD